VPRKQYRGADVYRKFYEDMFLILQNTPKIPIADLEITTCGNVEFSHSFQHVTGIDKQGKAIDRWIRVTNGYRKIGGNWLIALGTYFSTVDFTTGQSAPVREPF
jgi:ketosteroid isomerase-like protein